MFSRSEPTAAPATPAARSQDRTVGGLVLIGVIVLLIILALSADAAIFIPLNATDAVTQTWQAGHGGPALPPGHPRIGPTRPPQPDNPNDRAV